MGFHADQRPPALPGDLRNCLVLLARPTVVLCHSGTCSALATQQLQKNGLTRVANLRGGIRDWKAQGLPLEHPSATPTGP
ncbi:MAG: rhodanese-like domain-containing protein [Prochlorococcaceae cyanobacterium]